MKLKLQGEGSKEGRDDDAAVAVGSQPVVA